MVLLILLIAFFLIVVLPPYFFSRLTVRTFSLKIPALVACTLSLLAFVAVPGFFARGLIERSYNEEEVWSDTGYDYNWEEGAARTRRQAFNIDLPWNIIPMLTEIGPYPYGPMDEFLNIERRHNEAWFIRGAFVFFLSFFLGYHLFQRTRMQNKSRHGTA